MALVTLLGPLWQIECHQENLCDCIIIDSEFQKYSTIIGWVRASKRFIIYIYMVSEWYLYCQNLGTSLMGLIL